MDLEKEETEIMPNSFSEEFVHILQFCQLCHTKVVTPVLYTLWNIPQNDPWLLSVIASLGLTVAKNPKRTYSNNSPSNQEAKRISKASRTDESTRC